MKKRLALVIALAMVLGLIGCSGGSTTQPAAETPADSGEETQGEAGQEAVSGDTVKIGVLNW